MSRTASLRTLPWAVAACLLVAVQSGCTSALTAAALRNGLWDGAEHAAEADEPPAAEGTAATVADSPTTDPPAAADPARRQAALEESMARLSRLGPLDPAVEAAIVASLQRTDPQDWPVVVEEFAASLAAATPLPVARGVSAAPAAEPETPTSATEPALEPAPEPPAAEPPAVPPASEPGADAGAAPPPDDAVPPAPAAPAAPPALAARNACFASAVRGWGDVVRFPADRFRPGQEVIVYVELDNLSAGTSPAGRTTRIDAALRLVDGAGRSLHDWRFEPLSETRPALRRDYFARYVVRIPEAAPGGACRLELEVTDTHAGSKATVALPLEIAAD